MSLLIHVKNQTRQKFSHVEDLVRELGSLIRPPIERGEISILFCGDATMKRLNQTYRNKNKTTDVLSFCAEIPGILGDIAISVPQAKKQSDNNLIKELEMLLCHGLLHLLGYDHEINQKEYQRMMSLQSHLLQIKHTELQVL